MKLSMNGAMISYTMTAVACRTRTTRRHHTPCRRCRRRHDTTLPPTKSLLLPP
jgi:hypothetical protein